MVWTMCGRGQGSGFDLAEWLTSRLVVTLAVLVLVWLVYGLLYKSYSTTSSRVISVRPGPGVKIIN